MPYNGNVEIVGGLIPKNNADFKLINVKDIYYSDDKDLLDILGGFEEKGVREYITDLIGVDDKSGINGRIASLERNAANVKYVDEVKALANSKLDQAGFDNKFNTSFRAYTTDLDRHFGTLKTEVKDSLSEMEHITGFFKTVNSEHIAVETDAEGHILEYTDMDGTKYFTGKVKFGSGASFSTMHGEYLDVKIDASQRIIEYTDLKGNVHFNGELYAKNFTLGSNAKMYTGGYEYAAVDIDAAGAIIEYTDILGGKHFPGDVYVKNRLMVGSGPSFSTMNGEFLDVKTDASERIIEYTDLMGNVHFSGELYAKKFALGANAKMFTGGYEYAAVDIDASQRIIEYTDIFGAKHFPGDVYVKNRLIVGSGAKSFTMSPYEYLEVKLDASQNIVEATMPDGTKYLPCGLKTDSMRTRSIHSSTEYIAIVTDQADNILEGTFMNGDKLFTGNVYSKNLDEMNSALASAVSTLNYVTKTLYENNIIPEQPEIVYSEDEFEYDYMP